MGYKPPVELWCNDFMNKITTEITENNEINIMAVINHYVSVDKEELIKALNYDRQQYEKGYADAKAEYQRPQGKWIYTDKEDKEKGYGGYCSVCKCDMPIGMNDWKQEYYESKFCPNCGAKMVSSEKTQEV